jgi:hypothetical protein
MSTASGSTVLIITISVMISIMTAESIVAQSAKPLWSTQQLNSGSLSDLPSAASDRNPIDRYIRQEHRRAKITPQSTADQGTLVRRLYLDLLGIPPSPEQRAALAQNESPNAYEQLVDQVLGSPAYGERWARHWLDVARFAESSGFEHDSDRPNAYPYRDFVIQALNANLPFDTFLQWQIAGDKLAPDNAMANAATGFLGAGVFPTQLTEKEFESARYDELDDMVSTMGSAMLGLSIGCARCHDHKFDPIPASDYYSLAAIFTKTIRTEVDLTTDTGHSIKAMVSTEGKPPMKHAADGRGFPHFYSETYFLKRGDVTKKGEEAKPGFLSLFDASNTVQPSPTESRVALAKWITDPDQGAGRLAARVIVNRLWQHHFGTGLVSTTNDFGTQGSLPTHPELLDWLAQELINREWSIKAIQRLLLTSATYRQASTHSDAAAKIDPRNELLWRFPPRRLEAEAIRDSMLATSGLLDETPFGPGTLAPEMPRRSIYYFVKRSQIVPLMLLFDFPEPLVSIGQRASTNIAPQGLTLMNSPIVRSYALGLASRALANSNQGKPAKTINQLFEIAYGREASKAELNQSSEFLEHQRQRSPDGSQLEALADIAQSLFMSNEFLYLK